MAFTHWRPQGHQPSALLLFLPCPFCPPGWGDPWAAASVSHTPWFKWHPGWGQLSLWKGRSEAPLTCDQDSCHGKCPRASSGMEPASSRGPSCPRGVLHPLPLWWNPSYLFFKNLISVPTLSLSQSLSHHTTAQAKNTSGSRDQTQTEQDADLMRLPWKQVPFARQNVSAPGQGGGQGSVWWGVGGVG